jgi:hypothetical protein
MSSLSFNFDKQEMKTRKKIDWNEKLFNQMDEEEREFLLDSSLTPPYFPEGPPQKEQALPLKILSFFGAVFNMVGDAFAFQNFDFYNA